MQIHQHIFNNDIEKKVYNFRAHVRILKLSRYENVSICIYYVKYKKSIEAEEPNLDEVGIIAVS